MNDGSSSAMGPHIGRRALLTATLATVSAPVLASGAGRGMPGGRGAEAVDALFQAWDVPNTPGVAVAIVERGRVAYMRMFGRANIEDDIGWTPDTRYHIASITKQFIGALALALSSRGRFGLDDPIDRWLPELRPFSHAITIRHLLCHQSGIRVDEPMLELAGLGSGPALMTLDGMFDLVARQRRLNFQPGQFYEYNDAGSRLAARLIERATGRSVDELSRSMLFEPMGMRDTSYVNSWAESVPRSSNTYIRHRDGAWQRLHYNIESSGDGAVVSTLNDMVKWWGQYRDNPLGIADFARTMTSPVPLPGGRQSFYGLGWSNGVHRGEPYFQHTGSSGTLMVAFPKRDMCVLAFANRLEADRGINGHRIRDAWLGVEGREPAVAPLAFAAAAAGRESRFVDPLSGRFIDLEVRGNTARAVLMGESHYLRQGPGQRWHTQTGPTTLAFDAVRGGTALLVDMGEEAPVRYLRTDRKPMTAEAGKPWLGSYYSDEIRSVLTIEERASKMVVVLGTGVNADLVEPLEQPMPAVLTGDRTTIAGDAANGTVQSINVNYGRVRDVTYRRI